MKKQYKHPVTEIVKLNVSDAVLQEIDIVNNSTDVGDEGLGKKNDITLDDGDFWNKNPWNDGEDNTSYDLWGDN